MGLGNVEEIWCLAYLRQKWTKYGRDCTAGICGLFGSTTPSKVWSWVLVFTYGTEATKAKIIKVTTKTLIMLEQNKIKSKTS